MKINPSPKIAGAECGAWHFAGKMCTGLCHVTELKRGREKTSCDGEDANNVVAKWAPKGNATERLENIRVCWVFFFFLLGWVWFFCFIFGEGRGLICRET